MGFPLGSVIVTTVLLNVAWTCACPRGTLRRSRRRWRVAPRLRSAILLGYLLLDGLVRETTSLTWKKAASTPAA
jgi:hypothetical protein